jgi:hypothetical protein
MSFRYLFREFFAQLFISESSVSDHQVKVAMIARRKQVLITRRSLL